MYDKQEGFAPPFEKKEAALDALGYKLAKQLTEKVNAASELFQLGQAMHAEVRGESMFSAVFYTLVGGGGLSHVSWVRGIRTFYPPLVFAMLNVTQAKYAFVLG